MSASLRRLFLLAMAAPLLVGCKPPPAPTAGGLVSGSQPVATPVAAQPDTSIAIEPAVDSFSTAPSNATAPPPAPMPPPSGGTPLTANPDLLPVGVANSRGPQADAAPSETGAAAASPRSPSIRLSAGVAVPASLPGGTQMGISVDYAITGPLNGAAKYLWVIKSEAGQIESEVQLLTRGTLQAIVPLRPDDRPFNVQIVEVLTSGERKRVSNEAVMQTSY